MAWIGGAIAGAASLAGNVFSANSANAATAGANEMSQGIARDNNAFSERMSSTAYQRSTADLKAADLNPMLALMKGGASTPTPSSPTINPPNAQGVGPGINAAINAASTVAAMDKVHADTEVSRAAKALTEAQTTNALSSAGALDAKKDQTRQEMTSFGLRMEKLSNEAGGSWWQQQQERFKAGILNSEDLNAARYYSARADQLVTEAKITGLKVPEAVAEAAFWSSKFGHDFPTISRGAGIVGNVVGTAAKASTFK